MPQVIVHATIALITFLAPQSLEVIISTGYRVLIIRLVEQRVFARTRHGANVHLLCGIARMSNLPARAVSAIRRPCRAYVRTVFSLNRFGLSLTGITVSMLSLGAD